MRSLLAAFGSVVALGVSVPGAATAQDAAAGERIFLQCRTCHQLGETAKNAVGPQLNGLFEGRKKGSVEGYSYSNAYQAIKDQDWTVENFTTYIKDPRGVTPGTKMVYAGLKDETQIKNLIAFLQQYGKDGKKK
ncbi:MAG: c-type cytochrome [Beijerinckiaceae bacterium]